MSEPDEKTNFIIHVHPNDVEEIELRDGEFSKEVYILYKNSFINCPNIDIKNLINPNYTLSQDELTELHNSEKKFCLSFEQIIELKKKQIDFYILDKESLLKILRDENIQIKNSSIYVLEQKELYLVFFLDECKCISINKNSDDNNNNIQFYIPEQNIEICNYQQDNIINNSEHINNEIKTKIIRILILLYGNGKKIMQSFSQGMNDLKNYYLINNDWIEKFKEIYHYNELCNLNQISKIQTFDESLQISNNIEEINNINEIYNIINIDNQVLSQYNISYNEELYGENYYAPIKFIIVHESIINLLKYFTNISICLKYEIYVGKSSLCLKSNDNPNIIYIYDNIYKIFNLVGIFELFENEWESIYQNYLKNFSLLHFLENKNINIDLIKQKQNLFENNKIVGYLYLITKIGGNARKNKFDRKTNPKKRDCISHGTRNFNNNLLRNKETSKNIINKDIRNIRTNLFQQNVQNNKSDELIKKEKSKIIQILILLYINENEIMRLNFQNIYNLKNYYIVNKVWIDKFKELYNYREIISIPIINRIKTFNGYLPYIAYYNSLNEIKAFNHKINIKKNILSTINLSPQTQTIRGFSPPINFLIIHESIFNLINIPNNTNNLKYEITFGKSMIYFRWANDLNRIYVFNYNNIAYDLVALIDFNNDYLKGIYDKYLSVMSFYKYLIAKNIKFNIINQKQSILSSTNVGLGYIYLTNANIYSIYFDYIYNSLIRSLYYLEYNNLDLSNNATILNSIQKYLSLKQLKYLEVFIIENSKLKYYLSNRISQYISFEDIIPVDKISETTQYSFINEELIKYLQINNINDLPMGHLFINEIIDHERIIYIYYPKSNCLLRVLNYNNNIFNLKLIAIVKENAQPIVNKTFKRKHSSGLKNIGGSSHINAILQCLANINLIKDYFLNINNNKEIKNKIITSKFVDVINQLWSNEFEISYPPEDFLETLNEISPFKVSDIKNTKNILLLLYEYLHKELLNPKKNISQINLNNIPNELYQLRKNYYCINYSIISQIFYYESCETFVCGFCKHKKIIYNLKNTIEFSLDKVSLYMQKHNIFPSESSVIYLNHCFDQSQEAEIIMGANQINCMNCKINSNILSYNKMYTCPEVLTIIITRGEYSNLKIKIEQNIDIKNYVIDPTSGTAYELKGIIIHCFPHGAADYFVAYCISPVDNNWYAYNNDKINMCANNIENQIQSNYFPYILFYQRKNLNNVNNC